MKLSSIHGSMAMVASMGAFIASDSASKVTFVRVPLFEVIALRGFSAMVFCLLVVAAFRQSGRLGQMFNPWSLARGLCEVVANLAFTFAILHLPISDVTSIALIAPLLVLLAASVLWSERLGPMRLLLIGLGLSGALLVAQPGTSTFSPYALLGFLVAMSAAGRDLLTRKVPRDVPAPVVALSVLVLLTLAGAIGMLSSGTALVPNFTDGLLIVLAGALMVSGHVGVYLAYKSAPASSIAPFMYSIVIWATLSSVVLFGEIPNTLAIFGMLLVVAAGLLVLAADVRGSKNSEAAAS